MEKLNVALGALNDMIELFKENDDSAIEDSKTSSILNKTNIPPKITVPLLWSVEKYHRPKYCYNKDPTI